MLVTGTEHYRCFRSSQLLSVFLLVTTIFDVARLRSFILVQYDDKKLAFVVGFLLAFASKAMLFVLENISKRSILLDQELKSVRFYMKVDLSHWLTQRE